MTALHGSNEVMCVMRSLAHEACAMGSPPLEGLGEAGLHKKTRNLTFRVRVTDRVRTGDPQNHNLML